MRARERSNRAIFLACVFLWSSLATSCRSAQKPATTGTPLAPGQLTPVDQVLVQLEDAPDGLHVRLSDGRPGGGAAGERVKVAPATKLPEPAAQKVLQRLPALVGEKDDRKSFALRERSLPAPQSGKVIKGAFPPPPSKLRPPAANVAGTALKVTRFAPEGEVPVAPHLSITFNQPMVAITSHADTVARGVPVTLTPQPRGTWRWLGSKTLLFDPVVRFPAATEYKVEIAAGIKSASGAVLKRPVSFSFATPAPKVTQMWPQHGPQKRDPLMFVAFDQKVNADAVLPTIELVAGARAFKVRAATADEIAGDPAVKSLIAAEDKAEHQGRYVVFKPTGLLPADASVAVNVGPGTPSAEGPRETTSAQSFSFRTYGPMKIVEWRCSWGNNCPPSAPWSIRFSNPIDVEAFDPETIEVSPELPGMKVVASGQWMTIVGRSKGRTTYTVTMPASIPDTFDQTLGKKQDLTFRIGDAHPQIFGPTGLTLVDPAARKPTYDLHSINVPSLDVEIYRVTLDDWAGFVRFMEKNPRRPVPPPGRKVLDRTLKVAGSPDEMIETHIDLSPALNKSGHGHAVVVIKPTHWPDRHKPELNAWVQATDIALDAFSDSEELIGWATNLADGKPLPGVELSLTTGGKATTSAKGIATLALPTTVKQGARQRLVGRRGDDLAFLPENTYWWSDYGGWRKREDGEQLTWFVYDDRKMYRPGEKVHLKGWVRVVDLGERGDVEWAAGLVNDVSYTVIGPRGNEITKGKVDVNPLGGFDARFTLPTTPNLGHARVKLTARGKRGGEHHHSFQIQEFRRPEYEVTTTASEGPHLVGAGADVTVKAAYYAGGGLAGADVSWSVRSEPASFRPPGHDGFVFGIWEPWWTHHYDVPNQARYESFQGKTDATGQHTLRVDFLSIKPPRPMSLIAEAHVQDVNRQSWASSTALLVHPSELYVGLKQDRYFVDKGVPIEVQTVAVDHEGNPAVGAVIDMKAVRLDWSWKKGEWKEEEADPQACAVEAANKPGLCTFETPEGGTYRITATVTDKAGRPSSSQILVWVSGGDVPPVRNVEQEQVTLVPDSKEYRPGQTARLLVQAPFYPAHGLLSIRRSGITETRSFEMKSATTTLEVPITEAHVPNVFVQVDLVGSAPRLDDDGKPDPRLPRRPAYGKGVLDLAVPPVTRTLDVKVAPRLREIEPSGFTRVDVEVKDARGRPVSGAELSVVVVDEAVLALTGYATPDPLGAFYPRRPPGAADHHIRQYVTLARPDLGSLEVTEDSVAGGVGMATGGMRAAEAAPAPAPAAEPAADMAMDKDDMTRSEARQRAPGRAAVNSNGAPDTPIAVRKNFGALAVFAPEIRTDARGRADVAVKVPDNLTRYRVMVAAVAGQKQFGAGESSITARMPLMVRPSPPRFLNFGDRFEMPVVLQNQTERPMTVQVALRATNAAITDGHGRQVTVPANDRVEVRFPAAAEMAGTARFQFAAHSGRFADAAELALPVWTPATTEAFATYGEIDRGAIRQKVAMPKDVVTQFGQLEITTSSTQLQALTDAFLYLVSYPYDCAEQISSRILAVAGLRDVLSAFKADGLPSPRELEKAVTRDIEHLRTLQNPDGGFAFWVRGHESWPYLSIHGGHALTRAKEKGYQVPAQMIERNKQYLRQIKRHIPWWYPEDVKRTLRAYALYVRKRMGDLDVAEAHAIIREAGGADKLGMEAVGWLLATMARDKGSQAEIARIHRLLDNKVTETAATAHWVTSYSDGAHLLLHSDRRADGIVLEALMETKPKSDLVPKVVRGLLAHRKAGRWMNTQENVFVLLAMDRYFHTYEKVTPNFVSRVWLGDAFAGEHRFKGRQTDKHHIDIPMAYLARSLKGGAEDLILQKDGKGRLYYRVGMTYAPSSLWLPPADHGFAVERVYEPVDHPKDVVRQKDGSWKIKAGARVRVRVTMVAEGRRYHVALVDPLPAGLEPMNPALAVTGTIPQDPKQQPQGRFWWWLRTWYEHQNMRDERVEAFASLLWDGVHEYTYLARATTPGTFVVPPAKAEEMYFPETFGRSASDRVIVE